MCAEYYSRGRVDVMGQWEISQWAYFQCGRDPLQFWYRFVQILVSFSGCLGSIHPHALAYFTLGGIFCAETLWESTITFHSNLHVPFCTIIPKCCLQVSLSLPETLGQMNSPVRSLHTKVHWFLPCVSVVGITVSVHSNIHRKFPLDNTQIVHSSLFSFSTRAFTGEFSCTLATSKSAPFQPYMTIITTNASFWTCDGFRCRQLSTW